MKHQPKHEIVDQEAEMALKGLALYLSFLEARRPKSPNGRGNLTSVREAKNSIHLMPPLLTQEAA